jgi:ERF superfamily
MTEVVSFPAGAPAPATLVGAIASVMAEVHTVAKNGFNKFHGYRYATMGDVLKEITPLLGKHGLVIFQSETGRAMFDEDNVIAVEYAFTVAHVSGETWPQPLRQTGVSTCRNSKGGWDDKSLNKCHTAARKYFLLALFQIPTGEEADADQGENDGRFHQAAKTSTISDRAIAARDVDIEARRAAVQLRNALPQPSYVTEPPSRRLKREFAERSMGAALDAKLRAEQMKPGKFRQPIPQQQYNERNPPPHIDDEAPR